MDFNSDPLPAVLSRVVGAARQDQFSAEMQAAEATAASVAADASSSAAPLSPVSHAAFSPDREEDDLSFDARWKPVGHGTCAMW